MAVKTYSLKRDGNTSLSAHFKVREFRSKDGNDKILLNEALIPLLERLFDKLGCETIIITSGYRTNSHSIAVGGYAGDQHTKGNAADIRCNRGGKVIPAKEVCCALEEMEHAGGIGYISATAVHVDVRGNKSWFDETNGKTRIASWYDYFGIKKPAAPAKPEKIAPGSIIKMKSGAVYYNTGTKVPSWVLEKSWIVKSVSGSRAVIDKSADGKNAINSPVDVKYLTVVEAPSKQERTYTVQKGDSFWKIAAEQLGDGTRYKELAAYNGMKVTDTIFAGMVLKLME